MLAPTVVPTPSDSANPPPRLGYQASLDGLRAFAVVAVLLYHGGVGWASGGFLGVDVFFVLSGFLISTLLVEEWRRTGSIRVLAFYGRRARRLFPAMLPVLVAIAGYAAWLAPDGQLEQLRGELLATLAYVNNWHLVVKDVGYFQAFAAPSPLTHTWSLAVEEQWYLVWPVVVLGLLGRRRPLGTALVVTGAACVASAVWMAVLATPGGDPSRVYYGTDTRGQELLFGAFVAFACAAIGTVVVPLRWRRLLDLAGMAALAVIVWLCVVVDEATRWLYEGGMLVVSTLVAVVILAVLQPGGLLRRALGARPFQLVGLGSYALYLWHLPVYVVLSADWTGLRGAWLLVLRLAVTAVLAGVSYALVERPVRLRPARARALLAIGPLIAAAVVGTVLVTAAETALRVPVSAAADEAGGGLRELLTAFDPSGNPMPAIPSDDHLRLAVTGDSVALTLSAGFQKRPGDRIVLWDHSSLGCSLFDGDRVWGDERTDGGPQCAPWRVYRRTWLDEFRPHLAVVLSGVWESWDKVIDGHHLEFGEPAFDRWFGGQLDALIEEVSAVGARTVLLTAPCNLRARDLAGNAPPENDPDRLDHLNQLYREAADRHAGAAVVLDLAAQACPGGSYDASFRNEDGVHIDGPGAERLWKWLLPRLVSLRPSTANPR